MLPKRQIDCFLPLFQLGVLALNLRSFVCGKAKLFMKKLLEAALRPGAYEESVKA